MAVIEKKAPVIGLSWEPQLSTWFSTSSTASSSSSSSQDHLLANPISSQKSEELIDGLYVPPVHNPRKLNKLLRKQVKDTAGRNWFDMPAPTITPELKKDLQLLKLRSVLDPKRHYKKGDSKSKTLPKFFQMGTVIEPASEYYTGRLSKKERKNTLADELLSDSNLTQYRKRKVQEIEEKNRPGGVDKWKIRGQQSRQRAKERRH